MKDLVDRKLVKVLIDVLKDGADKGHPFPYDGAMAYINALPSEDSNEWIPCDEMLPEVDREVLVTNYAGGIYNIEIDSCGEYENGGGRFWYTSQNPIAWMLLPEIWKGKA